MSDDVDADALPVEDQGDQRPTYWLPKWWDAVSDWEKCRTCIRRNGSPCVSCEVPPGLLAMAQLVGGGVATVAGNMRGNQTITSQRQAQAAARVPGPSTIDVQSAVDQASTKRKLQRLQERKKRGNGL